MYCIIIISGCWNRQPATTRYTYTGQLWDHDSWLNRSERTPHARKKQGTKEHEQCDATISAIADKSTNKSKRIASSFSYHDIPSRRNGEWLGIYKWRIEAFTDKQSKSRFSRGRQWCGRRASKTKSLGSILRITGISSAISKEYYCLLYSWLRWSRRPRSGASSRNEPRWWSRLASVRSLWCHRSIRSSLESLLLSLLGSLLAPVGKAVLTENIGQGIDRSIHPSSTSSLIDDLWSQLVGIEWHWWDEEISTRQFLDQFSCKLEILDNCFICQPCLCQARTAGFVYQLWILDLDHHPFHHFEQ